MTSPWFGRFVWMAMSNSRSRISGTRVGQREFDADLGVLLGELAAEPRDLPPADLVGGADTKQASGWPRRRGEFGGGGVQRLHDGQGARMEEPALLGQGEAPCAAVHQAHAQPILQGGQAAADGGQGTVAPPRRLGEAARRHDAREESKVAEFIHGSLDNPSRVGGRHRAMRVDQKGCCRRWFALIPYRPLRASNSPWAAKTI